MENSPVTVITSSEEEKEEGNGSKEKNIERGVAAKSKLDEYKEIADLTGFDNLKAMILAESIMKRKKKRNRKKKKKDKTKLDSLYREVADLTGFENLKAMIEAEAPMRRKSSERMRGNLETQFCAQENDTVNVAEEQGQLGQDDGLNKVEETERNGREEKRRRANRAKLDEYEKISDLSGFDNLKAMIEAEAFMRRKKRNRKRKKREIEFCGQEDVSVSAEEEKGQLDKSQPLKVVEVSKPESVLTTEMDGSRHLFIDPAKDNEGASMGEPMPMVRVVGGNDGGNSFEVIDLCLSSTDDDKSVSGVSLERSVEDMGKAVQTTATITGANDGVKSVEMNNLYSLRLEDDKPLSDMRLGRRVEDTVSVGPIVGERQQKKRRKKTRVIEAKDKVEDARKENEAKYNVVLRMLLRKPRYFDPPGWNSETCSNCGKENHTAATCKMQKQNKPCFLCGSFKHRWKNCKQGQDCFINKGSEHLASDCPGTDQGNNLSSNFCLRCGDSGHDLFSCEGEYHADDLKKIQCYICKSFGHLCCVNSSIIGLKQVSCYNCGQSGHLGPDRLRISDLLFTAERPPTRARHFVGSNGTPHGLGNAQGREK
ncbi:zinc knuckle (CCHC-type) family protein [Citrus sinensis]|uniref:Zinc knuckle (CCHC-type) family protein n=1 Tax=Citrus sinensis TaxID=2711 RepID=A0ACB8JZ20_CITSI|nr:zinc knuckle (CCHC-type) family protein [Citrus sinensis]